MSSGCWPPVSVAAGAGLTCGATATVARSAPKTPSSPAKRQPLLAGACGEPSWACVTTRRRHPRDRGADDRHRPSAPRRDASDLRLVPGAEPGRHALSGRDLITGVEHDRPVDRSRSRGDTQRPVRIRVRAGDRSWAVIDAARLDSNREIAVSIHAVGIDEILGLVYRAYGLSNRQRELVTLVAQARTRARSPGRWSSRTTPSKTISSRSSTSSASTAVSNSSPGCSHITLARGGPCVHAPNWTIWAAPFSDRPTTEPHQIRRSRTCLCSRRRLASRQGCDMV